MVQEDLSFIDYVNTYYKNVSDEYIAYLNRWNLPKVGDKVVTLKSGFGGGAGVIRIVIDVDDKYISVREGEFGYEYLSIISQWYKEIKVVRG